MTCNGICSQCTLHKVVVLPKEEKQEEYIGEVEVKKTITGKLVGKVKNELKLIDSRN